MKSVELRLAWTWTCDECGRDQYERAIEGGFSEQEEREMREEHGVQPWEAGEWIRSTAIVRCNNCGAEFSVE